MGKSTYDQLVRSINERLREMAPENCETIEEAVRNAALLSEAFGTAPTSTADYDYCPKCNHPRYHGVCRVCD